MLFFRVFLKSDLPWFSIQSSNVYLRTIIIEKLLVYYLFHSFYDPVNFLNNNLRRTFSVRKMKAIVLA